MKKLVLLIALFFAMGMQANTIKEKHNLKLGVKKVEMPNYVKRYKCKSETQTSHYDDGNGGYYDVSVTITHCVPIE